MVNCLLSMFIEENLVDPDWGQARDKARASILEIDLENLDTNEEPTKSTPAPDNVRGARAVPTRQKPPGTGMVDSAPLNKATTPAEPKTFPGIGPPIAVAK